MNLYEILEVSESASIETINKIYKIQAKRYHPDLQETETEKIEAEEKMKKINEAYSILSDEQKRKKYDEELKLQREQQKRIEQQNIINNVNKTIQNQNVQRQVTPQNIIQQNSTNQVKAQSRPQQSYTNIRQKPYTQRDYARDYNRKLRQMRRQLWGRSLKTNIETFLIMMIIIFVIWFFPPTHKVIVKFYEENEILQLVVGIFKKIIFSVKDSFSGFI